MMEPTLIFGLASGALDLTVSHDGRLTLTHLGTGQQWETQLISSSRALAALYIWTAEGEEREKRRMGCGGEDSHDSGWGRDFGDEHRERRGRWEDANGAD